jgi:hypothetical protein
MRTLAHGQRVKVISVDGITINASGTVKRVCTDGSAWVELDKRNASGARVHPFDVGDSRDKNVRVEPEQCEPMLQGRAAGNRRARRQAKAIAAQPQRVTVEQFGRDHWSTFAYVTTTVADGGHIVRQHMRCNPKRHPLLAHIDWAATEEYPTRLKDGIELRNHDDWDCLDDLEEAGLVENVGTNMNRVMRLTELGLDVMKQLTEHKQNGGGYVTFSPRVSTAEAAL